MGLSTCAKACIGCGVCTAVVLAVMIPVTMLVIVPSVAPGMGQNALDATTMSIPESLAVPYSDLAACLTCSQITNQVVLDQESFPFSAKLAATDVVMHVPDPLMSGSNDLGWFTMPEQIVKHGSNSFDFTSNFTVFQALDFIFWGFGLKTDTPVQLSIVGQPKMTVLWGVSFELKLGKHMNCTVHDPENPVPGSVQLSCEQIGNLEESEIDSILAKFHNETTTPVEMTPVPTIETV